MVLFAKKVHMVVVDFNRQESSELKQDWIKKVIPPSLESGNNVSLFCEPKCKYVQTFHVRHQGCRASFRVIQPGCEVLL